MINEQRESKELRTYYPEIEPYRTGRLKVSDLHEIYFEECGNSNGKPVVHLHGGPGSGSQPIHRRYFDPAAYRIVLFDQRGSGKSTPHAELRENTTWHLVEDMERLRDHLAIERWQVFGGSWGVALALAYAQTHPQWVTEIVLRGIFTLRRRELHWLYQEGASALYPEEFERYLMPIPAAERHDVIAAFYRRLTAEDPNVQVEAAQAWSAWEASILSLHPDPERVAKFRGDKFATAMARIECHYFVNGGFFKPGSQLLDKVDTIRHIPGVIVQGRYDVVTPMMSAWDLHKAWPEAEFHIVPDAGHAATEPGIVDVLITATDRFRD